MTKRLLDVSLSVLGIVLLALPMLLVAAAIYIDDPHGSPIFKQVRLGEGQRPFVMYKFRSMRCDAEKDGPRWAVKNDSRCTRVGRLIRQVRIDELPQLFNVLLGQMSFVGPRPERPEFYDLFDHSVPGFRLRTAVPPGITGLAQVNGGYDLSPQEKLVYDMEYIKNRTIGLDLFCLFKTVGILLSREGAR